MLHGLKTFLKVYCSISMLYYYYYYTFHTLDASLCFIFCSEVWCVVVFLSLLLEFIRSANQQEYTLYLPGMLIV